MAERAVKGDAGGLAPVSTPASDPVEPLAARGILWLCGRQQELEAFISPARSVVENLAIDEAMTRAAAGDGRWTLRLWWGTDPTVVVGSSEKPEVVADLDACERLGVEVVKRSTGGGTVLQTPDVLNYSITGPAPVNFDVRAIFGEGARFLIDALGRLGVEAQARGISDVAVEGRKVSGNAMAKRWGGLLLHGTLLWDIDLDLLEACLRHPPREPDYRQGRGHRAFLVTLRELGVMGGRKELERALLRAAGVAE